MIKTLRPIHDRIEYSQPIASDMLQALWDAIFKPVFDILGIKTPARVNSIADLKNALRAGRIFWMDGYFYGEFNAAVGKALRDLGASFSSQKKAYKLGLDSIPMDMRTDIVIGKGMNQSKTERILKHLDELEKTKLIIGAGTKSVAMMSSLNEQTLNTFKVLPENLQIPMDLTDRQKTELLGSYQKNLSGYLEDWKKEQVERLRIKTQANASLGYRADRLAGIVKSEFGVSKAKATFIARQETSMLVSKYREQRYTGAGIKQYVWSTSHDQRVRSSHAELDHKIFSWDSPPVVDPATGRRANPGEDWNCRCLALPVIRLGVS
jgi:SPP1 gp7 family putative phage head morphogenesis protein